MKEDLESLFSRYNRAQWLMSDPISFAHRYRSAPDQEVVAFISALFSYGSVPLIRRALDSILTPLGKRPHTFLKNYNGKNLWPGFCHRFHKDVHIIHLMRLLKEVLRDYGSIEGLFTHGLSSEPGPNPWFRTESAMNLGVSRTTALLAQQGLEPHIVRGFKFLFNAPVGGSACKRLLMFLRWMVRKDDVDLGLWSALNPRELVIPLDTHVARLSYYLRLRASPESRAPHWKMACEVTHSLVRINPDDPVKYDFALARLGILQVCKRRFEKSVCERCDIEPACRYSKFRLSS